MATYTSEDVKQFLEGSTRINEERRMITQFCRMIAAGINRALKPIFDKTQRGSAIDLLVPVLGSEPIPFNIEWESKICSSGHNVRVWWDGTNITAQGADGLHANEIIALYDQLPVILGKVADCFPSLVPEIQFFVDAAKRQ
jgi:hypothetical protein